MSKGLIVLLSLGVVVGFGSGFARLAHHGCRAGGGCDDRWSEHRRWGEGWGERERFERSNLAPVAQPPVAAPAAPVYIVVPSAPSAAPIVINGVPAAPGANVVVVPSTPAPAAAVPQPAPGPQ
jgi:hypothetical protein